MLRLRETILLHLFSSAPKPSTSPLCSIHHRLRLLSAAAPPDTASPFAIEDYLVTTCGLTGAQALKASTRLSHLRSPTKPDAVLAFLAGLGLSRAEVAVVAANDPTFLCASVEKTLAPNAADLTDLGLSCPEIARLVPLARVHFRCRSIASKLQYYVPLFGSFDNLIRVLKYNDNVFGSDLERVVKPNVALLRECGLGAPDIAKLFLQMPRLINTKPEHLQATVACAEGIGVPRGSGMFRHALVAVAFRNEEKIAAEMENLKRTFMWSDAEVATAVSKFPSVLKRSKDKLQRLSEFLILEVSLKPEYIAHRPALLSYSLDGRLRPRHYIVKFLKANGLVEHHRDFYTAVMVSEKVFVNKFISPHKDAAPCLAQDYESACRGEVPTRFMLS